MKIKIVYYFLGIVFVCSIILLAYHIKGLKLSQQKEAKEIQKTSSRSVIPTPTSEQPLSADSFLNTLPPPTKGAKWSAMQPDTIRFEYIDEQGEIKMIYINGYSVSTTMAFTLTPNDTFSGSELNSYSSKASRNWELDQSNVADGPTGEIVDFKKSFGDRLQVMQFFYSENYKNFYGVEKPPECPCSYTYKVFLSNLFTIPHLVSTPGAGS